MEEEGLAQGHRLDRVVEVFTLVKLHLGTEQAAELRRLNTINVSHRRPWTGLCGGKLALLPRQAQCLSQSEAPGTCQCHHRKLTLEQALTTQVLLKTATTVVATVFRGTAAHIRGPPECTAPTGTLQTTRRS